MWTFIICFAVLLLVISVIFILSVIKRNKSNIIKNPVVIQIQADTNPKKPGRHDWLHKRD